MNLIDRIVAALVRLFQVGRDRRLEQWRAGRCLFHDPDMEYWCREPAVEDGYCWEHRPDAGEDGRAEWDDEDETRVWWRFR